MIIVPFEVGALLPTLPSAPSCLGYPCFPLCKMTHTSAVTQKDEEGTF